MSAIMGCVLEIKPGAPMIADKFYPRLCARVGETAGQRIGFNGVCSGSQFPANLRLRLLSAMMSKMAGIKWRSGFNRASRARMAREICPTGSPFAG
jgi:hypothetical protein